MDIPSEYVNTTTRGGVNDIPENVQGSPYANSSFTPGRISMKGSKSYPAFLRYNAYTDVIEMQGEEEPIYLLRSKDMEVKILNQTYRLFDFTDGSFEKKGYFVVLNSEGPAQLLLRQKSEFFEEQEALSSYSMSKPARFENETTYYLKFEGQPATPVRLKKKDVLSVFPSHKDEVTAYAKENQLKLKDSVEVIQLLKYYNASVK